MKGYKRGRATHTCDKYFQQASRHLSKQRLHTNIHTWKFEGACCATNAYTTCSLVMRLAWSVPLYAIIRQHP
ncbi:hypothetical protein E2C01_034291 [Portunus trituberculatus]|uniref:Uncharacterized protein n=1 Tax=Portunus trituberculatus TaxID=210409 RepID=A0A5B7F5C9_PORTR|nr:hypothetical protein [Portunus trituberculatus]